ncbi:DUF2332 domain-containing protein [Aquihabitans sp. G128]|uniref:DUF2332 domain-containing protein n=1 Tax=Aquihabitans sp. G128 TaxID=2849779 RepID=UPI001C23ECE4|nr:DUF2332 domain-containing protein [Aquihabitans sp. G128]QXC59153.1 DUF2332 domain-containing protein [Aquihabitans sp. G128]
MDTAQWYRWFGEHEAAGSSPTYERLALAVADDPEVVGRLDALPGAKRQPNLLFAAVRFLGGPVGTWPAFRAFVLDGWDQVAATMAERSTQTNEVARCATLLPLLSALPQPLALVEVGASAGLCLQPDRYAYAYRSGPGGTTVHEPAGPASTVRLEVEASGPVPFPERVPEVAWRAGIDLNPLDVTDPDHLAWLEACVWPEHEDRRARLLAAAAIAAADPPRLVAGDLVDEVGPLLDEVPAGATPVVIHTAVLNYLPAEPRRRFADVLAARPEVVWLAGEAPGVLPDADPATPPPTGRTGTHFQVVRGGTEVVAQADPHGRWLHWR